MMSNLSKTEKFSIQFLKDEIFNKKSNKKVIITSFDLHISELIHDHLKDRGRVVKLFNKDHDELNELFEEDSDSDSKHSAHSTPVLIMNDQKGPYTISEITYQCEMLRKIFLEAKNITNKGFIIVITFENPNNLFNPIAFPIKDVTEDWYPTIIPCEDEFVINVKEKMNECELINFSEDDNKIQLLCNQLYPPYRFKEINIINSKKITEQIKSNVFLLKKIYRDFSQSLYDVVKIDSKSKIQKEFLNYENINKESLNKYLYRVNNHTFLNGNFLGAISTTAINGSKISTLNKYIHDTIDNLNDSNFDEKSQRINQIFNEIHNFLKEIIKQDEQNEQNEQYIYNEEIDTYDLYCKTIIPFAFKININELNSIKNIIDNDFKKTIIDNPFYLHNKKINKLNGSITEINPNLQKDNICNLIIEMCDSNHINVKSVINIHSNNNIFNYNWPEFFIKNKIDEKSNIQISNPHCISYLYCILDKLELTNERESLNMDDNMDVDGPHSFKKKLNIEYFEKQRYIFNNNINPFNFFNNIINQKLIFDPSVSGHGDLNLDNILVNNNDVRIIDLASFNFELPLMFDYIKIETEIKNHILYKIVYNVLCDECKIKEIEKNNEIYYNITKLLGFTNNSEDNDVFSNENKFCNKFVSYVFDFEHSLFENNLKQDDNKIKFLFNTICEIRKKAFERAKLIIEDEEKFDLIKIYKQELFFYSLRTILYDNLSYWARLWSFIAASVAAT